MRFLKVLPFVGLSVTAFSLVALVLFTGVNPDTLNGDDSDDFEPFSVPLHGVNYYPQKTPWSLFWKHYDAKVVSSDLAKIKSMGFNTVRIFLPYPVFESKNRQIRERALRSTQNFLLQAEQYNLRCVLTLFDFYQDYGNTEAAIRHLQRIVPALKTSKALFAWDLKNELDRDEVQGTRVYSFGLTKILNV